MRLRIKNWDEQFENYKSREYDKCAFVCVPNKMGEGRRYLLGIGDGLAIFGLFINLVESCSTHPKPRRGWCTSGGKQTDRAWDIEDISAWFCRGNVDFAEKAIDVLKSDKVGWIEDLEVHAQYPPDTQKERTNERKKERKKEHHTSASPGGGGGSGGDKYPAGFIQFWSMYPRRGRERSSRKKCLELWKKNRLEGRTAEIIDALAAWIRSEVWTKSAGQYVCGADRWLREERYDTKPTPATAEPEEDGSFTPNRYDTPEKIAELKATLPTSAELERMAARR